MNSINLKIMEWNIKGEASFGWYSNISWLLNNFKVYNTKAKSEYIDDILERLISGSKEEKARIIKDIEYDVVKIEKALKQYANTAAKSEIEL